jgi:zinc transporter, ZIP family
MASRPYFPRTGGPRRSPSANAARELQAIGKMPAWFSQLHPVAQALLAGVFTWFVAAGGAALVFFARSINRKLLDAMLGFSGGVMLAASYWSLLAPAIEISEHGAGCRRSGWPCGWTRPACVTSCRPKTTWHRAVLLVTAITLRTGRPGGRSDWWSCRCRAPASRSPVGGNFPEGVAVAMPLRAEGLGRFKSFWYGQLSTAVEPIAAVVGAAAVVYAAPILPYALSFAAGAMIYVVVEELIPESHAAGNVDLATVSFIGGFVVMMILDVALS